MKRILSYSAVIIGLGLITSTALAQTTANGPYYATPSWDQQLPAATRFIVLLNWNNEAVLDRETGLVWQRTPFSLGNDWPSANDGCLGTMTGNRLGWRLPTVNELASLFDPSATTVPPLPLGHPFNAPTDGSFWSATPTSFGGVGGRHRTIGYRLGQFGVDFSLTGRTSDTSSNGVWCVRGGLQPGEQ